MDNLRYPIGKYQAPAVVSEADLQKWIADIAQLPTLLQNAVQNLDNTQLDTPYREEGWTLRQVIHHIADSHINAYTRYRLALTEENPTIRPYKEALWAMLPDASSAPIDISLPLIAAVHNRWALLLRNMTAAQWKRTFYHPESQITFSLDVNLGLYSWHGRHHLAHITNTIERLGW